MKAPDLWNLYRQMLRSRRFEEAASELWQKGMISGEMHLGLGEEAIVAGINAHLTVEDAMALDHRGTAPLVMRSVDLVLLLREFLGRADGLCSGWGGHMHLFAREHLAASSGIVGSAGPMACGFALAAQQLRPESLSVAYFGDGAMNQGMLLESLNLAAIWALPVLFICKDSGMAITTHSPTVTSGELTERVRGFGLPVWEVNGANVGEVWEAARSMSERARNGDGPSYLLAHCFHSQGHFLGDPLLRIVRRPVHETKQIISDLLQAAVARQGSRLKDRFGSLGTITALLGRTAAGQAVRPSDPLARTRRNLKADPDRLKQLEQEVDEQIRRAVQTALEPMPSVQSEGASASMAQRKMP
jgi:pyruvate dehydrogenase E1 component alpha subunit